MEKIISMLREELSSAREVVNGIEKAINSLTGNTLPVVINGKLKHVPDTMEMDMYVYNAGKIAKEVIGINTVTGKNRYKAKKIGKIVKPKAMTTISDDQFKFKCFCGKRFRTAQVMSWHVRKAVDKAHCKFRQEKGIKYTPSK